MNYIICSFFSFLLSHPNSSPLQPPLTLLLQRETVTEGESNESDGDRRSRATTPGRALLEEVSLRPPGERNIKNRLEPPPSQDSKCEFKNHFHSFMKTPAAVKRGRSFSQPRGKEDAGSGTEGGNLSRGESFKKELDPHEQERLELENHTKRFLQRKSLMRPIKHSDESGDDSLSLSVTQSSSKTADREERDSCSCSEDELEGSPVSAVVVSKAAPSKPAVAETNGCYNGLPRRRRPADSEAIGAAEDAVMVSAARRFERRQRSKSDITGLVSAGKGLEEEREEERREEERREEERREEGRKEKERERKERERKERDRKEQERREEEIMEKERRRKAEERAEEERKRIEEEGRKRRERKEEEEKRRKEEEEKKREDERKIREEGRKIREEERKIREEERKKIEDDSRRRKASVLGPPDCPPSITSYASAGYTKIGNSCPKPFRAAVCEEEESAVTASVTVASSLWGIPGARLLSPPPSQGDKKEKERSPRDNKENRKSQSREMSSSRREQRRAEHQGEAREGEGQDGQRRDSAGNTSTSDILAACKSGLRRLTYRKTYTRTRSHPLEEGHEEPVVPAKAHSPERGTERATRYTTGSSGSRIPNRPTTPGPYFGVERPVTPGPYRPFSPTPSLTSPAISRTSWKSSSQKFQYSRYKYGNRETFV